MRRLVGLTGWACGAALSAAGFTAAAAHAWSAVSAGELARGPVWAVVLVLALTGLLLSARVLLAVVVGATALAAGARTADGTLTALLGALAVALAPRALRPLVCGALALGVAVGVASPALAAAPASSSVSASSSVPASADLSSPTSARVAAADARRTLGRVDDLPAPGWPALGQGWRPRATATQARPGIELVTSGSRCQPDDEVVVRRGDTLWDLAARSLGPDAGDAEIAAAWPRWWHANREVIGADPDVLLPGTRLCVPDPHP